VSRAARCNGLGRPRPRCRRCTVGRLTVSPRRRPALQPRRSRPARGRIGRGRLDRNHADRAGRRSAPRDECPAVRDSGRPRRGAHRRPAARCPVGFASRASRRSSPPARGRADHGIERPSRGRTGGARYDRPSFAASHASSARAHRRDHRCRRPAAKCRRRPRLRHLQQVRRRARLAASAASAPTSLPAASVADEPGLRHLDRRTPPAASAPTRQPPVICGAGRACLRHLHRRGSRRYLRDRGNGRGASAAASPTSSPTPLAGPTAGRAEVAALPSGASNRSADGGGAPPRGSVVGRRWRRIAPGGSARGGSARGGSGAGGARRGEARQRGDAWQGQGGRANRIAVARDGPRAHRRARRRACGRRRPRRSAAVYEPARGARRGAASAGGRSPRWPDGRLRLRRRRWPAGCRRPGAGCPRRTAGGAASGKARARRALPSVVGISNGSEPSELADARSSDSVTTRGREVDDTGQLLVDLAGGLGGELGWNRLAGDGDSPHAAPAGSRSRARGSGRWPNSSAQELAERRCREHRAGCARRPPRSPRRPARRFCKPFVGRLAQESEYPARRPRVECRRAATRAGGVASFTIACMFSKSLERRYSRSVVSISHRQMPSENRSLRRSTRLPLHCSGER